MLIDNDPFLAQPVDLTIIDLRIENWSLVDLVGPKPLTPHYQVQIDSIWKVGITDDVTSVLPTDSYK